jgi:hypothetical protein
MPWHLGVNRVFRAETAMVDIDYQALQQRVFGNGHVDFFEMYPKLKTHLHLEFSGGEMDVVELSGYIHYCMISGLSRS